MDIYYSNAQSNNWDDIDITPFPMLASFFQIGNTKFKRQKKCSKLMLDSGAFSAFTQKKPVDIDKYIEYLLSHKKTFDYKIALDIFGDEKQSYLNWRKITKAGIKNIPVFHATASDWKYLYKYADETDYIGIGGIALLRYTNRKPLLAKIFTDFPDSTKIGFHGFGVNDERLMIEFPWRSVDARTAHLLARFGLIQTPWGPLRINPNFPSNGRKAIEWQQGIKKGIVFEWLNSIGANIPLAQEQTIPGKVERCRITIIYFEEYKKKCPIIYTSKANYLF
jgi:hypothetical protein